LSSAAGFTMLVQVYALSQVFTMPKRRRQSSYGKHKIVAKVIEKKFPFE
jgi:hypothetical protein